MSHAQAEISDPTTGHDSPDHPYYHVVPMKVLVGIFAALLVLTFITVAVTHFDFGPYAVVVALSIAVVKAALVALYFMHLRWDNPFNGIVLIAALVFVALFIAIATLDAREYKPRYDPPAAGSTK